MINLKNYEIWLLDYYDGNLSPEDECLLRNFIAQNPELEEDLDEMSLPELNAENIVLANKDSLMASLSTDLEDLQIAKLEGDLSLEDEIKYNDDIKVKSNIYHNTILPIDGIAMDKSLLYSDKFDENDIDDLILGSIDGSNSSNEQQWMNKHLTNEYITQQSQLFKSISFHPNKNIVFQNKEGLKKRPIVMLYMRRAISVAAMLAMVFYSVHLWQSNDKDSLRVLANQIELDPNADRTKDPHNNDRSLAMSEVDGNSDSEIDPIDSSIRSVDDQSENDINDTNVNRQAANINEEQKPYSFKKSNQKTEALFVGNYSDNERIESHVEDVNSIQINDLRRTIDVPDLLLANTNERLVKYDNSDPIKINQNVPSKNWLNDADSNNGQGSFASELEIDIPPLFYSVASAVGNAQEAYAVGQKKKRNILDFKLGGLSFYRSSRAND